VGQPTQAEHGGVNGQLKAKSGDDSVVVYAVNYSSVLGGAGSTNPPYQLAHTVRRDIK
jgi:hypothetical protein